MPFFYILFLSIKLESQTKSIFECEIKNHLEATIMKIDFEIEIHLEMQFEIENRNVIPFTKSKCILNFEIKTKIQFCHRYNIARFKSNGKIKSDLSAIVYQM